MFVCDQLRADHLGCYGNPIVRTPHIDGIGARGTRFDNFFVASPICMPNRATLMTGRMPSLHGVRHNGIPLRLDATVFTELLGAAGYRTALIGKCHLQNMLDKPAMVQADGGGGLQIAELSDARHDRIDGPEYEQESRRRWKDPAHDLGLPYYGFEHVELCDGHADETFGHYSRWLAARDPDAHKLCGPDNAIPDDRFVAPQAWRTRLPEELYSTSYVAERSEAFLADRAKGSRESPFFLQCSFPDPHHPFTPPGRFWEMYDPREIPAPETSGDPPENAPPHLRWLHAERAAGQTNLNTPRVIAVREREAREAIALTYGMISMIDGAVGRILRALQDSGEAGNTVVIFMSDHGDLMGDHGLLFKHPLHYRGLIRVPFLWAEPGDRPGRPCPALAGTLDVARSILNRAGIAAYNGLQGASLLPLVFEDAGASGHDSILIEEDGQRIFGGFEKPVRCRSLVTERWRMTVYDGVEWGEIYDLQNDPKEVNNLWPDPDFRRDKAELMERLARKMIACADKSPLPTGLA